MPLSRITPAIAPATALGRERVETLSTSALWRSRACAPVAPTARATGVAWVTLDDMRSSSGVVEISVEPGWAVSESCDSRFIVETPQYQRWARIRKLPCIINSAGLPDDSDFD